MEKKYLVIDLEKFKNRYDEITRRLNGAEMDFRGVAESNPNALWDGPKSVGVCRAELQAVQDIMAELYGTVGVSRKLVMDLESEATE